MDSAGSHHLQLLVEDLIEERVLGSELDYARGKGLFLGGRDYYLRLKTAASREDLDKWSGLEDASDRKSTRLNSSHWE